VTPDEIFQEVIVSPRRSFPALPDLQLIERPGWLQIITPSIKTGALNEVIFSQLDERDAPIEGVIDAAIDEYRSRGLKFRWNAGPGSAPADLGERLVKRGLIESTGRGMGRLIPPARQRAIADDAYDPAIAIAEVDAISIEAFSDVMAAGWNLERGPLAAVNAAILATSSARQRMFLATWDGEPVATASYVALPRSAYLIGGVVLPAFRGRGLYRALVSARLAHARAHGIVLATSHARESSSAPILERMGFATIARFSMYFG
jgi:GNAT superfamily N-acetyltransferase